MINDDFDMMAAPPPGHSLTQDNTNQPWGNPPKHATPEAAMQKAIDSLDEPTTKENLMNLLLAGVSVESLIEGFIYAGFEKGTFSLDVGVMMKGPLALYMAGMAEKSGVPYRFFENDNALEENKLENKEIFKIMKKNNPSMFNFMREELNKAIRTGGATKEVTDRGFLSMDNSGRSEG